MRRPPFLPLLIIALAVATMIGLGIWQLRRAEWKEGLLAELGRAATAPPLLIGSGPIPAGADFRRAQLRLSCPDRPATPRSGRNAAGQLGWAWRADCRTAAGEAVSAVLGWSAKAEQRTGAALPDRDVAGVLVPGDSGAAPMSFYLAEPVGTLQPAAPPQVADIPNNHRAYAVQWFAFALTALIISFLALRRRRD